jgi:type III pantothenate kinase
LKQDNPWLAIVIGNSRWHWAYFVGDRLQQVWHSPHRSEASDLFLDCPLPELETRAIAVYLASVVPTQTQRWQDYPNINILALKQVPLQGLYATLGIDRALAVLGLGAIARFPALAIDGGTALSFTGVNGDRQLVGGAILPGLGLQRSALNRGTAALPKVEVRESLPDRWAKNTEGAIASGIVYGLVAAIADYVRDWLVRYPQSAIALTGGDSELLYRGLQQQFPNFTRFMRLEPHLVFYGIRAIVLQDKSVY